MSSFGNKPSRSLAFAAWLAMALLVSACGGGGGDSASEGSNDNGDTPSDPPPTPDPAEPIVIIDSIPAAGATVSDTVSEFNLAHLGASEWQYEYAGDCTPTGVAVRRHLVDLSDETPYPEIVDHALTCEIEAPLDYELHVDTTASDGTEHRASLEFAVSPARQNDELAVQETQERSEGAVNRLYERFVRDAALNEFDTEVLGSIGASIVAEIAKDKWDELGSNNGRFGTYSERVTYPSRQPDGSAANLSGLIVRPRLEEGASLTAASRVVVLSHSTGSHPSSLDMDDPWYMLGNLLAGRGYLVIAPDNWGNDESADDGVPETYMLARRVAAASLDMIDSVLADDRYQSYIDATPTTDLAVIGYSQGGHSGMAVWLAHALKARENTIREVYIGAGPYDLYQMLRGGLLRHAERCNNSPWCDIDEQQLLRYVERWTMPGYFSYLDTGLSAADIYDDDGFTQAFINGYLDNEAKYDTLKALLQLNSFSNLMDLVGTVQATDTFFHIFHAEEDRTVPRQNSIELADTLSASFNVALHSGECNGRLFDQLSNLDTGAVHSVCALEMFNRVLKDLQPTVQADQSSAQQDAGAPWRALAEQRARQAVADPSSIEQLLGRLSASEIETMAASLEAMNTQATSNLAARLQGRSGDLTDQVGRD